MRTISSQLKNKFQLIVVLFLGFLFLDCDFNIFKLNQAPQIDSLYVVEQSEHILGDTLHLVCEAHDPEGKLLNYQWQSSTGTLIENGNSAILISENDLNINVFCKVSDLNGNSDIRTIELKFGDYCTLEGNLFFRENGSDIPLVEVPFEVKYDSHTINDTTNSDGAFLIELPILPATFSIVVEYENYVIDTIINRWDVTQLSSHRYADLNIAVSRFWNYFPVNVGNRWVFDSQYSYREYNYDNSRSYGFRGEETWEIININTQHNYLTIDIHFTGQNFVHTYYHISQKSSYTYGDSINWNMTVALNKIDSFWCFDSYLEGNNSPPCLYLVKEFKLPYKFFSNNDYIDYGVKTWHNIYWKFEKNVGPIEGYTMDSSDGITNDWFYSVELLSYLINQ